MIGFVGIRMISIKTHCSQGVLVFCSILGALQIANAQSENPEWNRFRGPNGTGVVADAQIPSEFGKNKNLVWRTELPKGYSSPAIANGRIYLTAEEDQNLFTICLDQNDGHEIWRKQAPRDRTEDLDPRNHAASATPVVDDDRVFVFFPDYGVIAYTRDGGEIWRRAMGPFTNLYGMGASPIVVDGVVILVCDQNLDSFVVGLDAKTGDVVWKTAREEATSGHCSPVSYRPDPNRPAQVVVAGSFNLTSYDAASGKKLWWVGGLCFEMKSTPFLTRDMAFINGFGSPQNQPDQNFDVAPFADVVAKQDGDGDGALSLDEMPGELSRNFFPAVDLDENQTLNEKEWSYFRSSIASKNSMMAIRLGGSGDMTRENTVWKYHKNIPQLPSPLLVGNQLLMISDRGIVTSLNPQTGSEQFKGRIPNAAGSVYASPVAAGEKILFATTSGKIAVVQFGDELNVLAVNDLNEEIYATPAIVGNQVFVRTDNAVYCFGVGGATK